MTKDEEREIARLYAETNTPTSEIRQRFGIGDSSLYRVVQRQGVALRGRTSTSAAQPTAGRARAASTRTAARGGGTPRGVGRPARGGPRRTAVRQATPPPAAQPVPRGDGARQHFRIQFRGERVIAASDIRDALRQAEAFGATEVTAVSREN